MKKDILSLIHQHMNSFSKGQKLIANYILNYYDKAAFMTANKLGKTVDVSESTVVRFAAELGFSGYPAMQKALQEMIRNKLTSIQRMEVSNDLIGSQDILSMVMQSDMEKIRITMEQTDRQSFHDSVHAIVNARRIYVLGIRSSSSLSSFLSFYFRLIFDNVIHVDEGTTIFEQIGRIGEQDVIIGISFPRYSQRTVKALNFARSQGATVIAITDSAESSVAKSAHHLLLAQSDMASFVDSLVAPLSMINALLVSVARQRSEEVAKTLENLEKIWTEDEVFVSPEDEV
jgi:DNA-binding MurR/RpiR family transcriptional regulator